MTRRSVFASLAAAAAAPASFRPLRALDGRKRRPRYGVDCYRGYLRWHGVKAEGVVSRPDDSPLEPLPVEEVEDDLITIRFKPWKYGTPPPEPGFAWGGTIGNRSGTCQLAAAILMDHTGDRELTGREVERFTDVLDALDTFRWEMSPAWIDQWLAEQARRRQDGRLRRHGAGRHSFPVW